MSRVVACFWNVRIGLGSGVGLLNGFSGRAVVGFRVTGELEGILWSVAGGL